MRPCARSSRAFSPTRWMRMAWSTQSSRVRRLYRVLSASSMMSQVARFCTFSMPSSSRRYSCQKLMPWIRPRPSSGVRERFPPVKKTCARSMNFRIVELMMKPRKKNAPCTPRSFTEPGPPRDEGAGREHGRHGEHEPEAVRRIPKDVRREIPHIEPPEHMAVVEDRDAEKRHDGKLGGGEQLRSIEARGCGLLGSPAIVDEVPHHAEADQIEDNEEAGRP